MKGTKEISKYLCATFCKQSSLGPPPINYATHPKRGMLAFGATSTTSPPKITQSASAPVLTIPSAHTSLSRFQSAIAIEEWLLDCILDSTPPSPDTPSFTQTQTATAPSTTVDSLADALDGLATDDTAPPAAAAAVPLPAPSFILSSPAPTGRRGPSKSKYYSVTVGKCCGVFQQW